MKNIFIRSTLIIILLMISSRVYSQLYFGITPGLQLNGAIFGYKIKNFVPYVGLQVMNGSVKLSQKGKRYDNNSGTIVDYEDIYNASGTVYMPSIGLKYFLIERGKLKAYGNICFTKFILSAKIEDSNNPAAPVDLSKAIDNISIFGGQIGFGVEYFFDENFSLGGEFGLRLLHLRYQNDYLVDVYNPNTGNDISTTTTTSSKYNFNPTYSKLALNFYFGK